MAQGQVPKWAGFARGSRWPHPPSCFIAQLLHGAANKDITLLFSGWVNPLLLIYLLFCIWRSFVWTHRVLAVAILACLASAWIFFVEVKFIPLIGHYLWVAGIVPILAPEVMNGAAAQGKIDSSEQNA